MNQFYVGGGASKTPQEVAFLKNKYSLFKTEIISDIFKDILNVKVLEIIKPKIVGLPHVTYFVKASDHKDYCFRANLGNSEPEIELLIEKLASDLARKNNIPTNNILYVDCSRKKYQFDFQIQERLIGNNPEYNFLGNKNDYDKLSFELGAIIAKLSQIKLQGFGPFDKNIALKENRLVGILPFNSEYIFVELFEQIKIVVDSGLMSFDQGKKIIQIFEDSRKILDIKSGSLTHYDLADHNFFYDPKTFAITGIFDWEAVCSSDPILDLASAPTWKTLWERESKLIQGFQSITKLPDNFKEKMNLYRLRTVIWKVVHNIKFNILDEGRKRRYLDALSPFGI